MYSLMAISAFPLPLFTVLLAGEYPTNCCTYRLKSLDIPFCHIQPPFSRALTVGQLLNTPMETAPPSVLPQWSLTLQAVADMARYTIGPKGIHTRPYLSPLRSCRNPNLCSPGKALLSSLGKGKRLVVSYWAVTDAYEILRHHAAC